MKDLYLMRHGETLFNVQGRTQGWSDSPLTDKGIAQAQEAGRFMATFPVKFDHYYSSTQERASDTLELVFPGVSYQRLKGLKEANFGYFEGHAQYLEPKNDQKITYYSNYGGENYEQVTDRMQRCLRQIMREADNAFCLSHGAAMYWFMRFKSENTDLSKIRGLRNLDMLHFTFDEATEKFSFIELIHTIVDENRNIENWEK